MRTKRTWVSAILLGLVVVFGLAVGFAPSILVSNAEATAEEDQIDMVELLDAILVEEGSSGEGDATTAGTVEQLATASAAYGPGSSGPCFIASAAYGTPLAGEIDVLRDLRDKYMLSNVAGTVLADTYYRQSPPIAHAVSKHPHVAAFVRTLLLPIVFAASMILEHPALVLLLPLVLTSYSFLRIRKYRRAQ